MKAEIFSIGTELLMGELADTNGPFIASKLPPMGIQLQGISQIGDNLEMLAEAFNRGWKRSDIIITSGGLGPTQDDLTREGVAAALGEEMSVQEHLLATLKDHFRRRGTDMPVTNVKQATLIPSAQAIPNHMGTAPGWWVERSGKIIINMPGPPAELQNMWDEEVVPKLKERVQGEIILTRNLKTTGLSEGIIDEMIAPFLGKENPYLGIYAKADGIHLRIIARAPTQEAARDLIRPVEDGLVSLVGPHIWGYDDETPERSVGHLLTRKGLTLGTIELCTGGHLAALLTDSADSTVFFKGGVVVHSNESATAAGVPGQVIEDHGIASQAAAKAMALAARRELDADIGIGVTGVTSADDPLTRRYIDENPMGLVHIAIALDGKVCYYPSRVAPRRTTIRRRGASTALIELTRLLKAE